MRFQTWPVVGAVPDAGAADGLLCQDLTGELDVEPPEVDQLAGGVDLGLVGGLGLAEHGGGGDLLAPRSGQQIGRAQEHRGALVERHPGPIGLGGQRGLDGCTGIGVFGVGQGAQLRAVTMRLHDIDACTAAHGVFAADDVRQVDRGAGEFAERSGEPGAFARARCVVVNRLVGRRGHVGDGIHESRIPDVTHATLVRSAKAYSHDQ